MKRIWVCEEHNVWLAMFPLLKAPIEIYASEALHRKNNTENLQLPHHIIFDKAPDSLQSALLAFIIAADSREYDGYQFPPFLKLTGHSAHKAYCILLSHTMAKDSQQHCLTSCRPHRIVVLGKPTP